MSATYTPVASFASPYGVAKALVPPNVLRIVPVFDIFTIWLSEVSATHSELGSLTSNSRSRGSFQPFVTSLIVDCTPAPVIFTMRLPPESAM